MTSLDMEKKYKKGMRRKTEIKKEEERGKELRKKCNLEDENTIMGKRNEIMKAIMLERGN